MKYPKYQPVVLKGVMCKSNPDGSLSIDRRVVEEESLIIKTTGNPMEQACHLAPGMWQGAFWYPAGEKDDKTAFMTWRVFVHVDMLDDVLATCQPRVLYPEGEDAAHRAKSLEIASSLGIEIVQGD